MDDAEVVLEYRGDRSALGGSDASRVTVRGKRRIPGEVEPLQTFSSAEVNSAPKADAEKSMVELQTVRSTAAVSYAG